MGKRAHPVGLMSSHVGEGRTVVITGGARGIGRACAQAFAGEGHRVAVLSRASSTDEFLCIPCDVTDNDQVDAAFSKVEAELGPAQVLVANAGITKDLLLARMSEDDFTQVLDTNLTGAFRAAKRALGPMMRRRWGRMIFMSSVTAYLGAPGQANYAAAKAGLIGLTRSIAREYASRGITANVVCPGPITTDMTADLSEERRAQMVAAVPLARFGTAEEVGGVVRFLASDEAAYVTGAVIPVDGGMGMGD